MTTKWEFYQNIPPIHNIAEATNQEHYHDVPQDWAIAITDVRGSTKAIQNGKYKDVNAIAAASITALLNHIPDIDLPFIFGGDGATILIPPEIVDEAGESLLATRKMAMEQFELDLRVGIIPVKDVLADGYQIRVARLFMSENFQQAIFSGGGLAYADKLLKDPERGEQYAINDAGSYRADFSGFECRWNKIRSPYEETVSVIITAVHGDAAEHSRIYREVLHQLEEIYGDSETRHPITAPNLQPAMNPYTLYCEARIRHNDDSLKQTLKLLYKVIKGKIAMAFDIQNWGSYRDILIAATDHEKFDDTLRMIISGTQEQQNTLRNYLETMRQQGELVYGIHTAQHALMTCIVFDHFGRQVHFVDGADGGYALAAKEMKAQLATIGTE